MKNLFYKYVVAILLISICVLIPLKDIILYGTLNIMSFWIILILLLIFAFIISKNKVHKIISIVTIAFVFFLSVISCLVSYHLYGTEQSFAALKGYLNVIQGKSNYYVIPFKSISPLYRSNGDVFICKNIEDEEMLLKILNDHYILNKIDKLKMINENNKKQLFEVYLDSEKSIYFYVVDKEEYSLFTFNL